MIVSFQGAEGEGVDRARLTPGVASRLCRSRVDRRGSWGASFRPLWATRSAAQSPPRESRQRVVTSLHRQIAHA